MSWQYARRCAQEQGHDVEWVRETAKGASDVDILARSYRERQILVTADFDFGELIFRDGKSAFGVVIVRVAEFRQSESDNAVAIVDRLERIGMDLSDCLTVLGASRTKRRRLPGSGPTSVWI